MDINLLKRLIKVVENSDITEFSVQEGDLKIKISKNSSNNQMVVSNPAVQMTHSVQAPQAVESVTKETTAASIEKSDSNLHEVKSPIVGTFYLAPAPDADPYIQVGDSVNEGSVLCIVEAMKLMNEIESDVNGKIVKILVENGTPVEYNQPLFLVEKN